MISGERVRARRGWLFAALLAGFGLRIVALPLGGTGDVRIWKVWSFGAAYDVTGMYGVGGSPPEQRIVRWDGEAMTVDYPPVALYELAIVGRFYSWMDPRFSEAPALNVLVKLPGLLFEFGLVALVLTWGRRRWGEAAAHWTAIALSLNPALILDGAVLGYLDPAMFVPLAIAVMLAWAGAPWLAGVLAAGAVLTKAQAIFVMPVVVALVARRRPGRWQSLGAFVAAGGLAAIVVLLPYVLRGSWWNLVNALSRLAAHDMVSAQAVNIWWIFTWVVRVMDSVQDWGWWGALTQEVRILMITTTVAIGYPNPRLVGLALVGFALATAVWWSSRVRTLGEAGALAGWSMYAYVMLAAQVHENHLVPAIPLLAVAGGFEKRFRPVCWGVSAIAALNLYLFYGIGPGLVPIVRRHHTIIDASVLLSVVNVAVFVWFTRLLVRRRPASGGP
jgi:hypothetical protein